MQRPAAIRLRYTSPLASLSIDRPFQYTKSNSDCGTMKVPEIVIVFLQFGATQSFIFLFASSIDPTNDSFYNPHSLNLRE